MGDNSDRKGERKSVSFVSWAQRDYRRDSMSNVQLLPFPIGTTAGEFREGVASKKQLEPRNMKVGFSQLPRTILLSYLETETIFSSFLLNRYLSV